MATQRSGFGVTFDFGQTLAELDAHALSRRLAERGLSVKPSDLEAALPGAWEAYNEAIAAGHEGHPWHHLMEVLLTSAGTEPSLVGPTVEWLWQEQPRYNLWRKPIPGMFELVRELFDQGVPLGIISNSEGRLAELAEELGIRQYFGVVGDSGRFGVPKPKPDIFLYVAAEMGLEPSQIIHIGDALEADVRGSLAVGMKAIWFGANPTLDLSAEPRLRTAKTADDVRQALAELAR